jgi:hypothetical protein
VRAIPQEKREDDVSKEQRHLKKATEMASEDAAVRKRKREEDHEGKAEAQAGGTWA